MANTNKRNEIAYKDFTAALSTVNDRLKFTYVEDGSKEKKWTKLGKDLADWCYTTNQINDPEVRRLNKIIDDDNHRRADYKICSLFNFLIVPRKQVLAPFTAAEDITLEDCTDPEATIKFVGFDGLSPRVLGPDEYTRVQLAFFKNVNPKCCKVPSLVSLDDSIHVLTAAEIETLPKAFKGGVRYYHSSKGFEYINKPLKATVPTYDEDLYAWSFTENSRENAYAGLMVDVIALASSKEALSGSPGQSSNNNTDVSNDSK